VALALPLALGLTLSTLVGGSLRALAELRLRAVSLFYAALVLQVVAFPFRPLPWHTSDRAATFLWICSYGLLFAAAVLNRRVPGVQLVLVGMACNLAAVLANGGHMPVRAGAMRAAGYDYLVHNNSASLAHPRLGLLIDRWAAPSWIPTANVFSVGDVVIALGAFAFALVTTGAVTRIVSTRRASVLGSTIRAGLRGASTSPRRAGDEYLVLVQFGDAYELVVRAGAPPEPASVVVAAGGRNHVVMKVAQSPLPGDRRPCVYLVPA
jgi:hypothetical protein